MIFELDSWVRQFVIRNVPDDSYSKLSFYLFNWSWLIIFALYVSNLL